MQTLPLGGQLVASAFYPVEGKEKEVVGQSPGVIDVCLGPLFFFKLIFAYVYVCGKRLRICTCVVPVHACAEVRG